MSNFDEKQISSSQALISSYTRTLERTDLDPIMRAAYEESIRAEQAYLDHLVSRREVYVIPKD